MQWLKLVTELDDKLFDEMDTQDVTELLTWGYEQNHSDETVDTVKPVIITHLDWLRDTKRGETVSKGNWI